MRIATWNCHAGTISTALGRLERLRPDLVALQECAAPDLLTVDAIWTGARRSKGLAVIGSKHCRAERARELQSVSSYAVAARVEGPVAFNVLGVWCHPEPTYVRHLLDIVEAHAAFLAERPSLVLGDFNSHPALDKTNGLTHHDLVNALRGAFGLVSAYHAFYRLKPGAERHPTYYHLFDRDKAFHIDYCFIPRTWVEGLVNVSVGSFDAWTEASDHRPLLVEFSPDLLPVV